MTPAILLLLGVGPLLWIAVINPRTVTDLLPRAMALPILAPTLIGAIWALIRGTVSTPNPTVHAVQVGLVVLSALTVATSWALFLRRQYLWARITAAGATLIVILAGTHLLHDEIMLQAIADQPYSKLKLMLQQTALCALLPVAPGLIPILLLSTVQGWTKALGRLTPFLVLTQPLIVLPILPYREMKIGWFLVGLALATSLLPPIALYIRRRGTIFASRLLLCSWPLTVFLCAYGFALLANDTAPWTLHPRQLNAPFNKPLSQEYNRISTLPTVG